MVVPTGDTLLLMVMLFGATTIISKVAPRLPCLDHPAGKLLLDGRALVSKRLGLLATKAVLASDDGVQPGGKSESSFGNLLLHDRNGLFVVLAT